MPYCVLIPAYCPDRRLLTYTDSLRKQGLQPLVVDDGSKSGTEIFDALEAQGVTVLRHAENRGKGQALKTGLAYALEHGFSGVITAVADGRYRVKDVLRVQQAMEGNAGKLILGVHEVQGAPAAVHIFNALIRFLFRLLYGLDLKAAQTGLRGIPLSERIMQALLAIPYSGYEFDTELLAESKTLFPGGVEQLDITVRAAEGRIYRPLKDGVSLLRVLLKVLPRFILSCLGTFLVNYILFNLLYYFVFHISIPATIIATTVSTALGFLINKKLVFRNAGKRFNAKNYFLLQAVLLAISTGAMYLLTDVLHLPAMLMKIAVEYGLHLINFTVQNRLSSLPGKAEEPI